MQTLQSENNYCFNPRLYPYQKECVGKMLAFLQRSEQRSVYNAMEMGLGKTACTVETFNHMNFGKVLIVCPAIMRLTWHREILQWLTLTRKTDTILSGSDLYKLDHNDILIISYDLVSKPDALKQVLKKKFDCIVLDEAHMVKSTKAIRTKQILKYIWPTIPYRICLSGTPFTASIADCWTVFSRMCPNFGTYHQFANRFTNVKITPWGPKYYGVKDASTLSKIIRERFFIRYTKKECLKDLPGKIFQKITLDKKYSLAEYEQALKALCPDTRNIDLEKLQSAMMSQAGTKRYQGIKKVVPIAEFTRGLLEQNIPVVLFAYHKEVIAKYKEEFAEFNPVVVDGAVSSANRDKAVDAFQTGKTNLFIGQMQAAGVGITLTRSSNIILSELDWSPSVIDQCVARCNRIGSVNTLLIHYFVCEGSIDEVVSNTVVNKARDFKKVIG